MRLAIIVGLAIVLGAIGLAGCQQNSTAGRHEAVDRNKSGQWADDSPEAKTLKAGEDFLAANAKKEGVKTLSSGLQYKVLKEGKGKSPKLTDKVTTNYRGTLLDGTEFDSSYKSGKPVEFPVGGVIKGWTEAVQLMHVGDKWQLFIPSNLAYGADGYPGTPIGPNETLIFEIELLGINLDAKHAGGDDNSH